MIVLGAPRLGFHGGVERHVFDLAAGLRARGHAVGLVHGGSEGRESERYAKGFDAVEPVRGARALVASARTVYVHKLESPELLGMVPAGARLFFAVHDHDRTCVRSHRYLPLTSAPCARPPGAACVVQGCVVVRDGAARFGLGLRDPFALARATRALSNRAHLVACSRFVLKTLLEAGVAPAHTSIVHPVPPEDAAPLVPAPSGPVLGFVGQIIRGKGLDLLLRALVLVPEARLVVAGSGGALEAEQARVRELGLTERVELLGPVPPEEVREVYDRVRVLVVPSRWPEPFGMIGVEAMRRGRVTVGAMHGGIPEWLDDGVTGVGFRPGDVADLARAVREATSDGRYATRAKAAIERGRTELSFGRMVDRVESLLGVAPAGPRRG